MNLQCHPGNIEGTINAPPSKSLTQRALAAAFLSKGTSGLFKFSHSNDSLAALDIIKNLGAEVVAGGDEITIMGGFLPKSKQLKCQESGLAMRMFAPIAALHENKFTFTGEGSLLKRPVGLIGEALSQLGVEFTSEDGLLPFTVKGPLRGGNAMIDGSVSSQLLTGLLLALPLTESDSQIRVSNLKSKPYVSMTMKLLADFGIYIENHNFELFKIPGQQKYNARDYTIEGDWSSAAFLLVAGAINGNIKVKGIQQDSLQSDKEILHVLQMAGADLKIHPDFIEIHKSELHSFLFDATHCPDLFPPLAALAAYCKGTSRIHGVERLIHKESNRAMAIQQELSKTGIKVRIEDNILSITGGRVKGAFVNSHNDHRIAMMAAVLALGSSGPVSIHDTECVAKSYPGFFSDLNNLGIHVEEIL
ncbi:MAG: 3-phosphoshikimate 1-carboxyvinyltransferase [Lentimicrobium sp.]|nr:3-phosphoshikimate 1-carboxyvinyltransferase [Lentimicrobium sp.]